MALLGLALAIATATQVLAPTVPPVAPPFPPEGLVGNVTELASHLTVANPKVRNDAEGALLALGPRATEVLFDLAMAAEPHTREAILRLLPRYGVEAAEPIYWASQRSHFSGARDVATAAVAAMGDAATPAIKRFLASPYPAPQFALGVLSRMGSLDLPLLDELLQHPDADVRAFATRVLVRRGDGGAIHRLLRALDGNDPAMQVDAARGLGSIGDRRAITPMLTLLKSPNAEVRAAASAALAKMYEPRMLAPLVRVARSDVETRVRSVAAHNLMQTNDRIAMRLGHRYKPYTTHPILEIQSNLGLLLRLFGSCGLIYFAIWSATWLSISGVISDSWALRLSAGGLAVFGCLWGRAFTGLSGRLELMLLLLVVPAAAWIAWWVPIPKVLRVPLGRITGIAVIVGVCVGILCVSALRLWLYVLAWGPAFLAMAVIGAVVASWWFGSRRGEPQPTIRRLATVAGVFAFYLGYFVGWLALWGYFGF